MSDHKKNETDLVREATATREQLQHEFRGVQAQSALPVTSHGHELPPAQVIAPDRRELALYADAHAKVCGNCKHFDLKRGREEMIKQRFPERLVREQDWKLHHLGGKLDELGMCGQSDGTMLTSFMSKSCDLYQEKK